MRVSHIALIALAPVALAACSGEAEEKDGGEAAAKVEAGEGAATSTSSNSSASQAPATWGAEGDAEPLSDGERPSELGPEEAEEMAVEGDEFADEAEFDAPPPPVMIEDDEDFE